MRCFHCAGAFVCFLTDGIGICQPDWCDLTSHNKLINILREQRSIPVIINMRWEQYTVDFYHAQWANRSETEHAYAHPTVDMTTFTISESKESDSFFLSSLLVVFTGNFFWPEAPIKTEPGGNTIARSYYSYTLWISFGCHSQAFLLLTSLLARRRVKTTVCRLWIIWFPPSSPVGLHNLLFLLLLR